MPPSATYPNGTHACEVEIDPETGEVTLLRYTVVDDFGYTLNPLLLAGQVHGGIAQGAGQALTEKAVFDENGQLVTASFMDYAMPRADDFCDFDFETRNIPSNTNPMGLKGAGEAGSIGSTPAVMNAIADALWRWHRSTTSTCPRRRSRCFRRCSRQPKSRARAVCVLPLSGGGSSAPPLPKEKDPPRTTRREFFQCLRLPPVVPKLT